MKATTGAIWEAASKDDSRPVLNLVQFDAEQGTLTATNSYIAARVPCDVEKDDESGLIPAAALKEAKGRSLAIRDGFATLSLYDGERRWKLGDGSFPDVPGLMAKYDLVEYPFGINHELLADLARAMGCGGKQFIPIKLHPVSPLKGMRVGGPMDAEGILMPVRIHHTDVPFVPASADLTNPEVLLAGVQAAQSALRARKGKRRATDAFHAASLRATLDAAKAAA